jgi:hypothetical protein
LIYKVNESTWSSGWRRRISFSNACCRSLPDHVACRSFVKHIITQPTQQHHAYPHLEIQAFHGK